MSTSPIKRKNSGWLELLLTRYRAVSGKEIAVGFPRGKCQAYPDGTQVAQVAAAHVYGLGVPVRDFMTFADPEIKRRTVPILRRIATETNEGNDKAVAALQEAAGLEAATAIKSAINEGTYQELSDYTKEKKGSDQPLVDTTHMLNATTYVVRNKRS